MLSSLWPKFLLLIFGPITIPINVIWRYISIRTEIWLETTPTQHLTKVRNVQRQVKQWIGRGDENKGQKMATARPAYKSIAVTKADKSKYFQVSVDLKQIVELNPEKKTVTLEPGVMMGQISRYLFKRGWILPIVPELDTLSIGGLVCGTGIESSSHKFGLFHDTCLSYEIVLPSGEVVTCSKENDPDLFYSIPGSFATVGFLTAVTIPLIPAKNYVKLQYRTASSIPALRTLLKSEPHHDFIEGLAYSKDRIVLMFGDLDDGLGSHKVHHINRWYKLPFYKLVEDIMNTELSSSSSFTEYIPLIDYYHRHSRGIFWELPKMMPFANYKLVLFLLGWNLPIQLDGRSLFPKSVIKYLTTGQIIQDYIVPMSRAEEFFAAGDRLLQIYPVWLCPVSIKKTSAMYPSHGDEDYIDLGYYSYPEAQGFRHKATLREMEQLCIKCKGFQLLYAECFMEKAEFHQMYDTSLYDRVREERGISSAFPHVYDKVGPKARHLDKLRDSE